ncbi:hypothetical protein D3C78_1736310 [compost metagenome]
MEVDVKTDHSAARLCVHWDAFYVQRMHGELITMAFTLWRSRATVTGLTEIGTGLYCASR